ncbi:hypothetical protein TNCV_4551231 [Trichonephila clavipes]|nr:hypothetical protein TNCV_4551231 [Trichonephila clavipes]
MKSLTRFAGLALLISPSKIEDTSVMRLSLKFARESFAGVWIRKSSWYLMKEPDEIASLLGEFSENESDSDELSCSNLESDEDIRLSESDFEESEES